MRILIDGSSLAGRDDVAGAVRAALQDQGSEVKLVRHCSTSPRLAAMIGWLWATLRPGALLTLWVVAFAAALDAAFSRAPGEGQVVVQSGGAAEALAIAQAYRHRLTAALLARVARGSGHDAAICLTASHLEKVRRYLRRDPKTALERLVLTDPDRSLQIDRAVWRWHAQAGAVVLDVDGMATAELLDTCLARVRAARASRVPALSPVLSPAA